MSNTVSVYKCTKRRISGGFVSVAFLLCCILSSSSVCISLHLCLMTSIDPCTPIHPAPSSTQTASLSAVGVSEGGHCQVVFEKHAVSFFSSLALKDKIAGARNITWPSSKNNNINACFWRLFIKVLHFSFQLSSVLTFLWGNLRVWMVEVGIGVYLKTHRTLICSSQISLFATWTHRKHPFSVSCYQLSC